MLEQIGLLVIVHANIQIVEHSREEIIDLSRHIHDMANTATRPHINYTRHYGLKHRKGLSEHGS